MTVLALPFPTTSCWKKHMAILETERTSKDMPGKEGRGRGKGGGERWLLEGVGHDRQREDHRVGAASGQGGEEGHSPLHSVVAYQALREVRWINIVPCVQNCVRSEEYLPLYWRIEAKVEGVSVERGFIPSRSGLAATISTRVKTASLGK